MATVLIEHLQKDKNLSKENFAREMRNWRMENTKKYLMKKFKLFSIKKSVNCGIGKFLQENEMYGCTYLQMLKQIFNFNSSKFSELLCRRARNDGEFGDGHCRMLLEKLAALGKLVVWVGWIWVLANLTWSRLVILALALLAVTFAPPLPLAPHFMAVLMFWQVGWLYKRFIKALQPIRFERVIGGDPALWVQG